MEAWQRGDENIHGSNEGFHCTSSHLNHWYVIMEVDEGNQVIQNIKDLKGYHSVFLNDMLEESQVSLLTSEPSTHCIVSTISTLYLTHVVKARWHMMTWLGCCFALVDLVLFWQAALWTCLAQRLHGHNKQWQSCWWVLRRGNGNSPLFLFLPPGQPCAFFYVIFENQTCYRFEKSHPFRICHSIKFRSSCLQLCLAFPDVKRCDFCDFSCRNRHGRGLFQRSKVFGRVPGSLQELCAPEYPNGYPVCDSLKNDEEPGTACVSRFFCCESDCGLLDRFKVRQMQHMPQKALLQLA